MVVTIVVLLILAGVSISLILDENGIIKKSKEAIEKYQEASRKEQEVLKPVIVHCQSISYKVTDEKRKHHRYNSDNKRVLIPHKILLAVCVA